jgi:predicted TIM-barrel fold metal-dependent hydrolase
MSDLLQSMIDIDQHYYEADDCFSRHIESKHRDAAIRLVPGGKDFSGQYRDDLGRWVVGETPMTYVEFNYGEVAFQPGTILGVLEGRKARSEVDLTQTLNAKMDLREAFDRPRRLQYLDQQGIRSCMLVPSHALSFEEDLEQRPDDWFANVRSFNRWLEEDWGFGADGRIYGMPIISLLDVDEACRELESVAARGARSFYFKMGPSFGRSPASTDLDPFWDRAEEIGIRPVLHIDNHSYFRMLPPMWGLPTYPSATSPLHEPFTKFLCDVWRPIQDTVAALILQDLFGRHPKLKMIIIECGSEWLPTALNYMDKAAKSGSARSTGRGAWDRGHHVVDGRTPSEVFKDHFWICPFPEDDIPALVREIGVERVVYGSDWPHSEGEIEPRNYLRRLDGLTDDEVATIVHHNGLAVLGLA